MSIKNIKYSILICSLSLLFVACVKKVEKLPVSEADLIKVLADLHLAEAGFQNLSTSSKDTLSYFYYDQVYQIHQVSKEDVDSSLAILNRQPEQFFEIYKKVQERLVAGAAENLKSGKKAKKEKKEE